MVHKSVTFYKKLGGFIPFLCCFMPLFNQKYTKWVTFLPKSTQNGLPKYTKQVTKNRGGGHGTNITYYKETAPLMK